MVAKLGAEKIKSAFARIGQLLDTTFEVELLLIGSAAALVAGILDDSAIATQDCDVLQYSPQDILGKIELLAETVGGELDLPKNWLNSDVQIRLSPDMLPDGWESRKVAIGPFGKLKVFAVGRIDLIATKFLAHRPADLEHLESFKVTGDERKFAERYLLELGNKGESQANIADALEVVKSWTVD